MDQGKETPEEPPKNWYPEKYQNIIINDAQFLKDLFAKVRSGEINPENEDEYIAYLVEDKIEKQRQLDESQLDPLLKKQGFYTKSYFDLYLEEAARKLNRNPKPRREGEAFHGEALLLVDLDNFRLANDEYGHQWGDAVLIDVAEVIKKHVLRSMDFVGRGSEENKTETNGNKTGRPGGDELAALLYDADLNGALIVANRIREELDNNPLQTPDGKNWQQTVSIGICVLEPGISAEETISRADIALYHAKANGRNRIEVYKEGMSQPKTTSKVPTDSGI